MHSVEVLPFSAENLIRALANEHVAASEVAEYTPVRYLTPYLKALGAESLVIEDPYTDGDFLDDYTAYYARCFTSYGRRCRRLHFFSCELTAETFRGEVSALRKSDQIEIIQQHYLGFIVARPLPRAIIGRTILRTYGFADRRYFPVSRPYRVNLFGIDVDIEGLAYQEQDTVLAACATVSLWSAFHKAGQLFGTPVPTPALITRAATHSDHYGRPIPQHGLRIEEICNAVRHNGLEPEVFDLSRAKSVPVASLLYGYLRMGLPVILIVSILGRGLHAITLTGYSLQPKRRAHSEVPDAWKIPPMVGLRIDKFYGHDDQVGPNSRLTIQDSPQHAVLPSAIRLESDLWSDSQGEPYLYPAAVVVPVYNKIRLTFLDLQTWILPLHEILANLFPSTDRVEWDVHLVLSNEYKKEVRTDPNLPQEVREDILMTHHPRFWWRATLRYSGLPFCDLLFDATGIARSFPITTVIWRIEAFAAYLFGQFQDSKNAAAISKMLRSEAYFEFLRLSLSHRNRPADLIRQHLRH